MVVSCEGVAAIPGEMDALGPARRGGPASLQMKEAGKFTGEEEPGAGGGGGGGKLA